MKNYIRSILAERDELLATSVCTPWADRGGLLGWKIKGLGTWLGGAGVSDSQTKTVRNESFCYGGHISELRPRILNPFEVSETSAQAPELMYD